jgi:hypothetical protein
VTWIVVHVLLLVPFMGFWRLCFRFVGSAGQKGRVGHRLGRGSVWWGAKGKVV